MRKEPAGQPPDQDDSQAVDTLLGQLRESEEQVVDGSDQRVTLRPASSSYGLAKRLGRGDGRNPGRDRDSVDTELPHELALQELAQVPRAALGAVAKTISVAYHSGKLGVVLPEVIKKRTTWLYLLLTAVVVVFVMIFETLIGQRVWQRLVAGITDDKAIVASLVLTAILAIGAILGARILHARYPGAIPTYGGRLVLSWLILVTATAALLAYVLGGGVQAQPTSGGISGGGPTSAPTFVAENFHLVLALAYFLLLVVANVAILGLHLYEQHQDDTLHVDANIAERKRAHAASVGPDRIDALYVQRLKECLGAVESVNHHGRAVVGAYNAGVRSTVDADLNGIWSPLEFDDSEPAWVAEVNAEIRHIERGAVRIAAIR